jgi:hypothetical protein
MSIHLSDDAIKTLPTPERLKSRIIFDTETKGFGIRIIANGTLSFVFDYRRQRDSKQRRCTIGSFGVWTTAQARREAKRLKREVNLGYDPLDDGPILEERIARKAMMLLEQGTEPVCYLYRHYHPNGDLLYVGISLYVLARHLQHIKKSAWQTSIFKILIEPFAAREEALAAEELAIRTEFPKFNTVHNNRRHPLQEISRIDRVRLQPISETPTA